MVTVIKIRKEFKDNIDIAVKYYSIISILNNFNWSETEIYLIAYMSIKGNINSGGAKNNFLEWFNKSSINYIDQVISSLKQKGFIIKENKKVLLHPGLLVELKENLILQLNMTSGN